MMRARRLGMVVLALGAGSSACASDAPVKPGVAVGRVPLGAVEARVLPVEGGVQACVDGVRGEAVSERWCVGPHAGRDGAGRSWSRAERLADGSVVYLAVLGPGDRLDDDRFAFGPGASGSITVTVAAGLLTDHPGPVVCSTYLSGTRRVRYDTAVSGELGAEQVEVPAEGSPCAVDSRPRKLVPVVVEGAPGAGWPSSPEVARITGAVAGFYAEALGGVEPVRPVADPRAAVLVDHAEAGDPCATTRTRLGLLAARSEILVVFGGTISSAAPFTLFYGTACGGRAHSCAVQRDDNAPNDGAMVLVDAGAAAEVDLSVVVAHEVGHVLGLRHPGDADCSGHRTPTGGGNVMAVGSDHLHEPAAQRGLRLDQLTLTTEQRATVTAAGS